MKMLLVFLVVVTATVLNAWAESGESVVVLYNSAMPESRAVAEHYAQIRAVPEEQLLGLELPTIETITRSEFRNDLEKPLYRWLQKQKLFTFKMESLPTTNQQSSKIFWRVKETKIRYLVLCYGVPVRILHDNDVREPEADKLPPQLHRNGASVDSELVLLPMLDANPPVYGLLANAAYGATNAAILNPTNGLLVVGRLDGPTPAIAKSLVDKALAAELDGLWGRAYFDLRGITNSDYKLGDQWLDKGAEMTRQKGFETIMDGRSETFSAAFPMSDIAIYAGWYDGAVSGPFTRPKVEFMPGAFAYHLHSYSAATIRSPDKNWVGPLLAKGATATMGCVDEPYLAATPDIAMFLSRWMYLGFSFGEAAWASQSALSWQNVVIGDPLYQPFIKPPAELHQSLVARKSPMLQWSHLAVVNLNLVHGFPVSEVISYLEEVGTNSPVLMEKLGDLYQRDGKKWKALSAYAQALNLGPSRQQELRLSLTLGDGFEAAGRPEEALSVYRLLTRKMPDYPDLAKIYERMIGLARKLDKADQVELYQKELQKVSTRK